METTYFDEAACFEEYLARDYHAVLKHPLVQRLKDISFLATIDVLNNLKRRYSRYDHSLGVAFLAYYAAKRLNLSEEEKKTLVLAGLLHDIGHVPFSHAAEPFLLENLGRYHEGLTIAFLSRFRDVISKLGISFEKVKSLIIGNSKDGILHCLSSGAISLDTLDATNRTAFQLGMSIIDPRKIIDSMYRNNGKGYYIQYREIPLLVKFARFQNNLYEQHIYTQEVLAAEAMLTRALELAFNSEELIQQFKYMKEDEALEKISQSWYSNVLVQMIREHKLFKPLSKVDISLYREIGLIDRKNISEIRLDRKKRQEIEETVAQRYGLPKEFVIFHYSPVRKFEISPLVHQSSLFSNKEDIPIESKLRLFTKKRESGARFDIFLPHDSAGYQVRLLDLPHLRL